MGVKHRSYRRGHKMKGGEYMVAYRQMGSRPPGQGISGQKEVDGEDKGEEEK